MGQPNAKDVKRKSYMASTMSGGSSRPAVRPSVYTDAVLVSATTSGATNNNNSSNSRNNSVIGSGVTGGASAAAAAPQHTRHVDPARMGSARNASGGGAAAAGAVVSVSNRNNNNSGNSSSNNSSSSGSSHTYPIVLRYVGRYVQMCLDKRKPVSVCVEALNWQPLAMTPSTDSFYALLELPPGQHNFRFLIDGREVIDDAQPLAPSGGGGGATHEYASAQHSSGGSPRAGDHDAAAAAGVRATAPLPAPLPPRDGKLANTVYLNEVLLTTREDDDIMDDGEGWGQDVIMFEESRKYPPVMPVHLRYTPLNTPSTMLHHHHSHSHSHNSSAAAGGVADAGSGNGYEAYADVNLPPEHLPLPLSVTINHVYFQRRDDHAVMGVTTRYCNKFTTVVYYTHMPAASGADVASAAAASMPTTTTSAGNSNNNNSSDGGDGAVVEKTNACA